MATIFSITITIGKGDAARERTISIDPEDMPMGILEDLEAIGNSRKWSDIRPIMVDLFGLTNEEFRAITTRQFIQIAAALQGAVFDAATIPNGVTPPPQSASS